MGRDHSIECPRCGVQRGGLNNLLCHCDYPPASDEQIELHQQVVRGMNLCGEIAPDNHTICILERGHPPSKDREGWACDSHITSLVMHCPKCWTLHLDVGEWRDRPHKTHLCLNEECGHLWRPYDFEVHTRGISVEEADRAQLIEAVARELTTDDLRALLGRGRAACGHLGVLQHYNGGLDACLVCGAAS